MRLVIYFDIFGDIIFITILLISSVMLRLKVNVDIFSDIVFGGLCGYL